MGEGEEEEGRNRGGGAREGEGGRRIGKAEEDDAFLQLQPTITQIQTDKGSRQAGRQVGRQAGHDSNQSSFM